MNITTETLLLFASLYVGLQNNSVYSIILVGKIFRYAVTT